MTTRDGSKPLLQMAQATTTNRGRGVGVGAAGGGASSSSLVLTKDASTGSASSTTNSAGAVLPVTPSVVGRMAFGPDEVAAEPVASEAARAARDEQARPPLE